MYPEKRRRVKKREEEGGVSLPQYNTTETKQDRCGGAPERPPGRTRPLHCLGPGGSFSESGSGGPTGSGEHSGGANGGTNLGFPLPRPQPRADHRHIYNAVIAQGTYNFVGARQRVPSGLSISAWKQYLIGYEDKQLVQLLEFGWPINFDRSAILMSTMHNHASAVQHGQDIQHYVDTELGHGALLGPFDEPPVAPTHISPLMTRPKKGSSHRRIIMDLSWPAGAAVNDGVDGDWYMGREVTIKLPTVQFMEDRLLQLGRGAWMYKTDLARGYRQLRVDPSDWPLLGFQHQGKFYMDLCPPFGLKTSALFMQRTSEAISYIHGLYGYLSRPYLDDFGGAERTKQRAEGALDTLQGVMARLGIVEATHKVCRPSQHMIWLGIYFDSLAMTMRIPDDKMTEIQEILAEWEGRQRATRSDMQSLLGLLQFVASVSPPARIFTNRMLEDLREAPRRGTETLSMGFKRDLRFFIDLWPAYNGIRILIKEDIPCQGDLELDACTTGCGAYNGEQYYSEEFPGAIQQAEHTIAHLELLNIVVAVRTWARDWAHQKVGVHCDNMNACLAVRSGKSRDGYMQSCVRELFLLCSINDIELHVTHCPGTDMKRADALSRAHTGQVFRDRIKADIALNRARQVRIPTGAFDITNVM